MHMLWAAGVTTKKICTYIFSTNFEYDDKKFAPIWILSASRLPHLKSFSDAVIDWMQLENNP